MASWMAMGRKYALAQPALCSLYYSLRLISTNPIGPSHVTRFSPVHYIVGWTGIYLRSIFCGRMRKPHTLSYNHRSGKPMMENTMVKTPKHFIPEAAFEFLCKDSNILWCPYNANKWFPIWSNQVFCLSIRRGLLPLRRTRLCIAEPYYPDRVAQQFRLDQVIPYSSLVQLYAEADFRVAHAYWTHLLRPVQEDLHLIPDETRIGGCSMHWLRWYKRFYDPFISVSDNLHHGIIHGNIPLEDRRRRAVDRVITARRLSSHDFFVIQRVPSLNNSHYIASLKAKKRKFR